MGIRIELLASFALALILPWRARSLPKNRSLGWLGIIFLLPALLPAGGGDIFGAGERWAAIYPVVLMALAAFEQGIDLPGRPAAPPRSLFILAPILAALFTAGGALACAHPLRLDPDYPAYERLVDDLAHRNIPLLIAHRGLNFYYKFRLRRESFPFEPEKSWDHTRIWRLSYRITPAEMNYYLPENCRFGSGRVQPLSVPDYLLIREDCWDAFRQKVRLVDDDDLHSRVFGNWRNPSQKRPAFLYARHSQDSASEFPAAP